LPDPLAFATANRVLLLRSSGGVGIDLAFGALDFERRAVERSSDWSIAEDLSLRTCSAEDLIVYKAFAGRPQDWIDVEMIGARQGKRLAAGLVFAEVEPLLELKEAPEDVARLRSLLAR